MKLMQLSRVVDMLRKVPSRLLLLVEQSSINLLCSCRMDWMAQAVAARFNCNLGQILPTTELAECIFASVPLEHKMRLA